MWSAALLFFQLMRLMRMTEISGYGRVINDAGLDQPYYMGATWVILSPDEESVIAPLLPRPGFHA